MFKNKLFLAIAHQILFSCTKQLFAWQFNLSVESILQSFCLSLPLAFLQCDLAIGKYFAEFCLSLPLAFFQCDYEPIDATSSNYLQHPSSSKRKNRQQREAEMTLQLLEPEVPSEAAIRKEQEALELVVAAKETLNQDQVWVHFYKNYTFVQIHAKCFICENIFVRIY